MRFTRFAFIAILLAGCGKPTKDTSDAPLTPLTHNPQRVTPQPPKPYEPSKPEPTPKEETKATPDPDEALKAKAEDMGEYIAGLKNGVPFDIKKFTAKGFKAESYEKDTRREWFMSVVLVVKPVYLTDKITGVTARYTRAEMTRNDPVARPNTVPTPFEWVKIKMLP